MFGLFFAGKASQVATTIVLTATTGAVATGLIISDTEVPEPTTTTAIVEEVESVPETTVTTEVVVTEASVDGDADDEGEDETEDVAPEAETGPVDDEGVPYGTVACDEAENHGEYVSGVARDERVAESDGPRGQIVSEAAKTDCGKSNDEDDSDELDEDEGKEDEDGDDRSDGTRDNDEESDDEESDDEPRGNGNGNGNGRGNGK